MKYARTATNVAGASGHVPVKAERASLAGLFNRRLEDDLIVLDDEWLQTSGVQRQLEFEGFQLRWVTTDKLRSNLADGWQYVTVSYYLWWVRRVRRRLGRRHQYLLKRGRSFRSRDGGYQIRATSSGPV